jgi:hypothetical protein
MMHSGKKCNLCQKHKPLSEYYKHKGCVDGHVGQCKSCHTQKSNAYRKTDAGKESVKKYQQTESYKIRRKAFNESENGRLSMSKGAKKFAERHPKQAKAHTTFSNALRLGKVFPMPCIICGAAKTEGHHPDYDQPLSVIWLCRPHHLEVHLMAKKLGEIK